MITKAEAIRQVCIETGAGDIVSTLSTWFWVIDVREPSHPAAPGIVWEGYYWEHGSMPEWDDDGNEVEPARAGHWGPLRVWHVHEDCAFVPRILTADERDALAFPGV